jgi:sigma-B regulation protein RsbU (phosphoserine phosphatase)
MICFTPSRDDAYFNGLKRYNYPDFTLISAFNQHMPLDSPDDAGGHLALLYQLSQTFNSSLDLDEVLNKVMDEVIAATHAERGFVMLIEADEKPVFRVARGLDQTTINQPQFQVSRSITERVAMEGQPVLTSDAQTDERFNIRQSILFLGLRSILCVPLSLKGRTIGVIYVDNRLQAGIFTQADLRLLSAIGSSAAIAIENARLYQLAVEKGRLEQELLTARRVQMGLLPRQLPSIPGWEFVIRWKPARQVGGDYYDFIYTEDGQLGLVIADVTDKGMPAALFMAFTRSIIHANLDHAIDPAAGITRANRLICQESENGLFVTLFYGLLNPQTGQIVYVNAGHNPPILVTSPREGRSCQVAWLPGTGMPLGVEEDNLYTQNVVQLKSGDFIVLYTDGITEAIDADKNQFGMERLQQVLLDNQGLTSDEIVVALEKAIDQFTGDLAPFDDITVLIARRK